jgi:hypothetical protein
MTDLIKSKQYHFDVPRFSASLMLKFLEFVFLFKATFIFRQTFKKRGGVNILCTMHKEERRKGKD